MGDYDLRILVIDDDITQLALMQKQIEVLPNPRCQLDCEDDPERALSLMKKESYDLIITDYNMSGLSGHEVFEKIKEYNPQIPVVIITAVSDIELAISMLKEGVYDFLVKPVKEDILERLLMRVLDHCQLEKEILKLKESIHRNFSVDSILGSSKPIRQVIDTIGRCSRHNVNVMVRGESGTGKELVAHALHYSSPCADGPFVIVNIAALSESLVESELFGHAKGAFTGAEQERAGRFEEAHGGTLFIDEVGDISPAVQVKLLRAIQFKQFQRIGENRTRTSEVRIITATSRNLEEMMEEGSFRSDLYYRLNVVEITMPPLRDRKDDIPELALHFYNRYREENFLEEKEFSREAMHLLMSYSYPGNVRELQNIIEHAAVFSRGQQITSRDLPPAIQKMSSDSPVQWADLGYDEAMEAFEKNLINTALEESEGNQSEAARQLGITERRLRYRLEKLGINSSTRLPE